MVSTPMSSIGGLVSGLDTATIVNQLMQLEATSQTRLKSRMSTEQSTVSITQALNASIAALATSATNLTKPSAWASVKATSSVASVAATAGTAAIPGSLQFSVDTLASAHRLTFTDTAALSDVVTTGSTSVSFTASDGTVTQIESGDGTLKGLVAAINAAGVGVQASTVALDGGQQRLQVQSLKTGAANDFTLTNLDGSALLGGNSIMAGTDAAITVGADTIHSATNTFAGVLPGVDVTVGASTPLGTAVDITLARDSSILSSSVKSFVNAINAALSTIDSKSAWDPITKTAGPLSADSSVRALRNGLLNAVYPTDGSSMAAVGIQLDRFGKLVFDTDAFAEAYAEDPAAVQAAFASTASPGFADRVKTVAVTASDSVTGTITGSINGSNTDIKRLQQSIDDWDIRLDMRRATLNSQFTAMETAMGQMQSQSNWLASQLSALSSNSNSGS